MKKLILIMAIALLPIGCKDATQAQFRSLGKRHRVEMYSGGQKVREWTSTGNISNEVHSDGWYFEDEATGKLVEVTGQLVITVLD